MEIERGAILWTERHIDIQRETDKHTMKVRDRQTQIHLRVRQIKRHIRR